MKTKTNIMTAIESDLKNKRDSNINFVVNGLKTCKSTAKEFRDNGHSFYYRKEDKIFIITNLSYNETTYVRVSKDAILGYEFWVSENFDERHYVVKNMIL